MNRKIKWIPKDRTLKLPDDSEIFYEKGKFDSWRVTYKSNGMKNYFQDGAPLDKDYLSDLASFSQNTDSKKIVKRDFDEIFDKVLERARSTSGNPVPVQEDFDDIIIIARKYKSNPWHALKTFCILYMTMISEWHYVLKNGDRTKYKHLLKKLAVYQVLCDINPVAAANTSKGLSPKGMHDKFDEYNIDYRYIEEFKIDLSKEQYPLA
ncbi:hypothetical protein WOSG25_060890 [Weissella oryzae SG25]|uniref:Uncharacterized protein n=1 Tax=Weissella oryzae (strain DSM 25784 / JCM 18191 / LMG 30913 / SG25) TaxID=1329250 RepID=A0A069CU90_WEIOS|nr:hypothetical protein [Weissella oryzae]GAK30967.1 hypothetical protein WOSG25_060890 [Weissella oryzae SG25]